MVNVPRTFSADFIIVGNKKCTAQQGSVYFPTLTSVDVSAHVKTEPVLTYSIARVRICLGLYLHTLRSGGASAAAVHTLLVLHRSGASTGNFAAPSARPTVMIFVNVFTTKMPLDANFDILDGSEVKKRAYKTPKRAHGGLMCIFPGIHSKTEVHTPASKLTCARRHTYSPEVSHTTARTRTYILYLRSGTQARRMLTYSSKTHIH